jgi:hypothetical protein
MNHTCCFFPATDSLLFFLLSQHGNWNPIINHPVPRLLQRTMNCLIMLSHRDSPENFRQCHQISIRAQLHQVMLELRVSRLYDFETLSW